MHCTIHQIKIYAVDDIIHPELLIKQPGNEKEFYFTSLTKIVIEKD